MQPLIREEVKCLKQSLAITLIEMYQKRYIHMKLKVYYYNYVVFMAKPEKALLDKLYTISPVSNKKELKKLLFESLRIDEDRFASLNKELMIKLIPKYKSTNLYILKRLIEKEISKK